MLNSPQIWDQMDVTNWQSAFVYDDEDVKRGLMCRPLDQPQETNSDHNIYTSAYYNIRTYHGWPNEPRVRFYVLAHHFYFSISLATIALH
jgi:hypothetical protein